MPRGRGRVPLLFCMCAPLVGAAVRMSVAASDPCTPMAVTGREAAAGVHSAIQETFTIASLNIAGNPRIADTLTRLAQDRGIDVLLLQEVGDRSGDASVFVATLGDRLGFHFAYAPADRLDEMHTQGLAILSRDPLSDVRTYPLERHQLRFKSRCRIGQAATVRTAAGPIRLMNVHLDTRINSRDRLAQLEPLLAALGQVEGPQIIGGDFNTMDIGWVGSMLPFPYTQHQESAIRNRLAEDGFVTPFVGGRPTLKLLGLPLRLDWLFLKHIETLEWSVDTVPGTDHRGVSARVKLKAEGSAVQLNQGSS
jgi:endonuclease/exonuclease/phosphatase family metal-dependent hydrolase